MLVAGTDGVDHRPPSWFLSAALTRPTDQYRDSSEEAMDEVYQHMDHMLILFSPSIGEPGLIAGFPL